MTSLEGSGLEEERKWNARVGGRRGTRPVIAELAAEISRTAGPAGPGSGAPSSGSGSLTHRSRLVTGATQAGADSGGQSRGGKNQRRRSKAGGGGYSGKEVAILVLGGLGFMAGMGLLAFGVLVMLGMFPFQETAPQPAFAAPAEGRQVTYGSVIKLMHEKTKFRLHSHDVPYGTGSGQQSVTGFPGGEDSNSYWVVKPISGKPFQQGEPIYDGDEIRLFHMNTRKWLHSHLHASPISNNYEVSAFGSPEQSDTGDHWSLLIEGKGNTWMRDQKVRLQHGDTGVYLQSHDKKYSRIIAGQQEVCGVLKRNPDNIWMAAEGVYFPVKRAIEPEI